MRPILSLAAVAAITGCVTTLPSFQPGSARVLTTVDGTVRIEMVRSQEKPKEYYVRITGTESDVDGYVMIHTANTTASSHYHYWSTSVRGRSWTMLLKNNPANNPVFEFQKNPVATGVPLELDREAAQKLDVEELLRAHVRQRDDGSLAKFQSFDRQRDQREVEQEIRQLATEFVERCGADIPIEIDWATFTDEELTEHGIASYCGPAIDQLAELCETDSGRTSVQSDVQRLVCRGDDESMVSLDGGALTWQFELGESGLAPTARNAILDLPWTAGPIRPRVYRDRAVICGDGKGRFVGHYPAEGTHYRVIYFDGERWLSVRKLGTRGSRFDQFFDPRFFNPTANSTLRGMDFRYISNVVIPRDRSKCTLTCGPQVVELQILTDAERDEVLPLALPELAPQPRKPHALARDNRGTYYFVDVGGDENSRDFRVYLGPKGNMKQLKMKNVVTDSEGDIFITESGELRLVLENPESLWVRGKKLTTLKNIPLAENWEVIYNQLGVYIGVLYGTPCDHM